MEADLLLWLALLDKRLQLARNGGDFVEEVKLARVEALRFARQALDN